MGTSLLTLVLRSKRDILLARQRARQVAGLLGYKPREQALIAAAVFEIAWNACCQGGRKAVHFEVEDHSFQVFAAAFDRRDAEEAKAAASSLFGKKLDPRAAKKLLERIKKKGPARTDPAFRLEKPLPVKSDGLSREDATWIVHQLARHASLNLFEEIHQQNQELLLLAAEQAPVVKIVAA